MKNEELIRKWLTDQPLTAEEERLLKESDEFAQIEKIWDGLPVATPPKYNVDAELERFHAARKKQTKVIKVAWHKQWVGVAAAVALIAVIGFLLLQPSAQPQPIMLSKGLTPYYLPDSSIVTLNKGSELAYEAEQWATARKVTLKGEGFFEVKKGATFQVATANGIVTVLGTAFNVKQRGNYYEVICYEGKVGVATEKQNVTLIAGNGYREAAEDQAQFDFTLAGKPGWLSGRSTFFRTPYYAVLEELKNQYGVVIETSNVNLNATFTGSFPNNNLDVALNAITTPAGYLYQQKNGKVLITGEQ